jgi:alpha-galactosidase
MKKAIIFILVVWLGFMQALTANETQKTETPEIYTPAPAPKPRINGPLLYGARPGHPFLYRLPCQGERPVRFSVSGLPAGLSLDAASCIISGKTPLAGKYKLTITA